MINPDGVIHGNYRCSLSGRDLVRQKVRLLSIMAGAFEPINGKVHLEYNVVKDVPSAQKLASEWPTEIVFSGFEIGLAATYPAISIERDYGYVPHHPLAESYVLYNPPPHNRPTWDLTSVLYAVYPDRGFFDVSPFGRVVIDDRGQTSLEPKADGLAGSTQHRYLIMSLEQRIRVVEALVQLSSEPPH